MVTYMQSVGRASYGRSIEPVEHPEIKKMNEPVQLRSIIPVI